MPSITSTPACLVRPSYRRRASAASAITPPSPSLSARISTITYLTDTISVTDQKISETTPYTSPLGRTNRAVVDREHRLQLIQRAGADVAEHDAQGGDQKP